MRLLCRFAALLLLAQTGAICSQGAEVIDRIVASVNRQVILESELRFAMAYQCVVNQTSCHPGDPTERKAALDRLIDQRLLEQQMVQAQTSAGVVEAARVIADLREQILGAGKANSDAAWADVLHANALTEQDLAQEASRESRVLRFVDSRFRSNLRIDEASIENYYRDVLVKQLTAAGAEVPKLSEVTGRIREVLAQQEINRELTAWIQTLHEQSAVRIR